MATTDLLSAEVATFESLRKELIGCAVGKYALVHGDELCGVFESNKDAIRQGYERFGNAPFLVKQVVEVEIPQHFTSNLMGV
ncbi:hypothetical protein FJZ36_17655 [Candidatus Poribacteria bacterium]|nr:hypothetical protein [Candidatus Poribacteria bacterium]